MELFVRELLRTRCRRRDLRLTTKDLLLEVFDNGICSTDSTDIIDAKENEDEDIGISRLFEIDTNPVDNEEVGAPIYETEVNNKSI